MTKSTSENDPISDEATRGASSGGEDTFGFSAFGDETDLGALPRRIGDYEVKRLIGSGGMGQVYLAEHVRMQRTVALKMLPVQRMRDERALARFYDEIRTASRLMHPNIVTAFDAGEGDGIHYLAMEYVDGMTLTEVVSQQGPLSVGDAASAIRQAALGLLHAHRAGVIHRDVKPGNLMRAGDGTVKILDLGLARIGSLQPVASPSAAALAEADVQKPARGRLVGTLPFMSPEQLEDPDAADARSDIYSLGATMYFVLTGRVPFGGEFIDQVYGHRHGEVPDLMQVRDDVDLRLAHIFQRMMAKSPSERYVSLDEVIDGLSHYGDVSSAPSWVTEIVQREIRSDDTTIRSGSTDQGTSRVLGIDAGMVYAAAAEAAPSGEVQSLCAGGPDRPLFRMAVASQGDHLVYGDEAIQRRADQPQQVAHCVPMYIGQPLVERLIGGRRCPPEVLLAMMFRRVLRQAWSGGVPDAVAITVPASYDQLHRRSVLQSASMAGLRSVRLIDRSLAAAQTLLMDRAGDELDEVDDVSADAEHMAVDVGQDQTVLFVGLTGQASEAAVIRREPTRLQQLATAGHWHHGTLAWQRRLVDYAAETFREQHGLDPRQSLRMAATLQVGCERAMNSLLLMPTVHVALEVKGQSRSVSLQRHRWLQRCGDLLQGLARAVDAACQRASVTRREIDVCLTLGPLLRIQAVREAVFGGWPSETVFRTVDRQETARGAAACLAGELPGRRDIAMAPRSVTSQTIGIVVEDKQRRRRILPVVPRGTLLPARTNRRLSTGAGRSTMSLSLVESSGVESDDWHALGRHEFDLAGEGEPVHTRMIAFEVDVNGLLIVRAQRPGAPGSVRLTTLPAPVMSEDAVAEWTRWLSQIN